MSTYRAIEATADGGFTLSERELREPGAGEVRIAVEACGVCNGDSIGILNLTSTRPTGVPVVPGHEIVGRIDAVGDDVSGWSIGQRVGLSYLGGHCGECQMCRRGDFVYCTDQPVLGNSQDGGYAEYVTARASGLVAVPDDAPAAELAPLMCAGLTVHHALRTSAARAGDLVAVQGIGGLGHLGIQYARAMGFRVAAISRGQGKKDLALELGAHHHIDSAEVDPAQALQALGGAKVILATASHAGSMSPLVAGLAVRGQLVVVGASMDPVEVLTPTLIFGGRSIVGSLTGTPSDNEDNVAFARAHDIHSMIETVPLEKAGDAYAKMMAGEARFRMVLTTSTNQ
ncbi:alcohol dehydrogenase, propanol-preferring [Saccharopolyspora shandongensis]|uniref:Alcohol dehydrogenase, propanol-preferring n=1 Tax=Saccharopolyspora shandongensis TaxID=418495 RepID=A0A1H3RMI2_9PSEU|nr:alcohol dehydrogenase catalytic domain-containing protein [Saccharopolyspora shandongensis]SDZ26833.1 alcohol dehydrogenase, propanol-preferring [Saccharopolyspora shandongensis]